jgi:hypothetical protein
MCVYEKKESVSLFAPQARLNTTADLLVWNVKIKRKLKERPDPQQMTSERDKRE